MSLRKGLLKRIVIAHITVVVALFSLISLLKPTQAAEPFLGLSISPPYFELTANPGDSLQETIKVSNQSSNVVRYRALVQDFKVEGTEGVVTLEDDLGTGSFSKWVTVNPGEFELNPKEVKLVTYTINAPQNAEPGGHFASVLFQPVSIAKEESTGPQTIQQVGALVLLNVKGDSKESGAIEKFNAKTFIGSWEEALGSDGKTKILIAKDEKLTEEKAGKYFSKGPIGFDLLIKNNGNVHFRPVGFVSIYNIFGQRIAQLAIDPRNVFPGGERRITVIWPKKSLWGGYYRAQVLALYGSQNQSFTAETTFFAFPSTFGLGILGGLLIIILARKRLAAAIRILVKGG